MQRRAAAVYAAFFLLITIGSWAVNTYGLVPDQEGLIWITTLSGVTVVLLVSMSYLPVRG